MLGEPFVFLKRAALPRGGVVGGMASVRKGEVHTKFTRITRSKLHEAILAVIEAEHWRKGMYVRVATGHLARIGRVPDEVHFVRRQAAQSVVNELVAGLLRGHVRRG